MTIQEANKRFRTALGECFEVVGRTALPPAARRIFAAAIAADRRFSILTWSVQGGKYVWDPERVVCLEVEALLFEMERCRDCLQRLLVNTRDAEAETRN